MAPKSRASTVARLTPGFKFRQPHYLVFLPSASSIGCPNMLCIVCSNIDFDEATRLDDDRPGYPHHANVQDLYISAQRGCRLCNCIWSARALANHEHTQYSSRSPSQLWLTVQTRPFSSSSQIGPGIENVFIRSHPGSLMVDWKPVFLSELTVYADEGSPAASDGYISGRPVDSRSGSERSFKAVRRWISNCIEDHGASCAWKQSAQLPTRVIDVGTGGGRVFIRHTAQQNGAWVALSHCWGNKPNFTLKSMTPIGPDHPIYLSELPPSYRDAVTVTRSIGLRYLWVDSLCILQDSPVDWAHESTLMRTYYKDAILTIAADSASGDDQGFLNVDRILHPELVQVPFRRGLSPWGVAPIEHVYFRPHYPQSATLHPGPLSNRAWTMQEAMLSRRILHYGQSLQFWECEKEIYTESSIEPTSVDAHPRITSNSLFLSPEIMNPEITSPTSGAAVMVQSPPSRWLELIGNYVRRQITFQKDTLPAISGIAREMQSKTNMQYCGGIWVEDLHRGLCWRRSGASVQPSVYIAPSWSWASFGVQPPSAAASRANRGLYEHLDDRLGKRTRPIATLMYHGVVSVDNDPFGRLRSGYLTMSGQCSSGLSLRKEREPLEASKLQDGRADWSVWASLDSMDDKEGAAFIASETTPSTAISTLLIMEVVLLPILSWTDSDTFEDGSIYALMLVPADPEGTYRRVGICGYRVKANGLSKHAGWQDRIITIV